MTAEGAQRADVFLVTQGFAKSRAEAQSAINAGHVRADGHDVSKPSQTLRPGMAIEYAPAHLYVSRGALKLLAALEYFQLSPKDRICLDLGASTGGFTQVLLEQGAKHVYSVDVGSSQLNPTLANDPRVIAMENINARMLTREVIAESPDAIVADLSFISLKLGAPAALELAAPDCWFIGLIKPQFEVGRAHVGKGGIVRDADAQARATASIAEWLSAEMGWRVIGTMKSPIQGGDGNREFLIAATRA